MKHFVLDPDRRVIEVDLLTWGRWVGKLENREVASTEVGHLLVLTSFAGIDISFGDGPPAFFETRVLDGCDELECLESGSWDEAITGHEALASSACRAGDEMPAWRKPPPICCLNRRSVDQVIRPCQAGPIGARRALRSRR